MTQVKNDFVTFYSPGTFFPEQTTKPIDSWDVNAACEMAHDICERYDARPYAFRFTTRGRGPDDLDSKVTASSNLYYLGGTIRTAEEVLAGTSKDEEILRRNVEINKIKNIVQNRNSWLFTGEFGDDDTILDWKPRSKK